MPIINNKQYKLKLIPIDQYIKFQVNCNEMLTEQEAMKIQENAGYPINEYRFMSFKIIKKLDYEITWNTIVK